MGKTQKCVKMEKLTLLAKVLHLSEWIFLPTNLLKRLFHVRVLEWLVSGSREEMGKSTFRSGALRAVDWPSTPS